MVCILSEHTPRCNINSTTFTALDKMKKGESISLTTIRSDLLQRTHLDVGANYEKSLYKKGEKMEKNITGRIKHNLADFRERKEKRTPGTA